RFPRCNPQSSLGRSIDAARELWIRFFVVRHGPVYIRTVDASLVEGSRWPDLVRRASILPNEAAQVTEPLSARERPECLLAEVERNRRILRRRNAQRRQRRRLEDTLRRR